LKKKLIHIALYAAACLTLNQLWSQQDRVFVAFDLSKPASFPGGPREFYAFWKKHLIYPPDALRKGLGGFTILTFVIEKDGSSSNIRVANPIDTTLKEHLRSIVAEKIPCWVAAEANGNPVRQLVGIYMYFHPHAGQYVLGEGSVVDNYERYAALPEKELYKIIRGLKSRPLPHLPAKFQIPVEAVAARVNGEAIISFTVTADGLLRDPKIVQDPGYGCGQVALDVVAAKKYWIPQCYCDTCFDQTMTERIAFVTDTAALHNSERIFEEDEVDLNNYIDNTRIEYLRDSVAQSGWIKVSYVTEKNGTISSVEYGHSDDPQILAAAKKRMQQYIGWRSLHHYHQFCGLPCRVRFVQYWYFRVEDKCFYIFKKPPDALQPIPLLRKTYRLDELDKRPTHQYGDYGIRQLSRKIWTYPAAARQKKIEGAVQIRLKITENGTPHGKILHGIGGGCDEEALRIVHSEGWIPGRINGFPVESVLPVSVYFKLE
jgi:periplasmic protein TonB